MRPQPDAASSWSASPGCLFPGLPEHWVGGPVYVDTISSACGLVAILFQMDAVIFLFSLLFVLCATHLTNTSQWCAQLAILWANPCTVLIGVHAPGPWLMTWHAACEHDSKKLRKPASTFTSWDLRQQVPASEDRVLPFASAKRQPINYIR